ncbi:Striated muscle preferentially expressed protein kinase, partial [Ophiophagus hannah]
MFHLCMFEYVDIRHKRALVSEGVLNIVACKDGRQLLTISKVSKKDAGLYECNATNALGTATSSCTIAVARLPGRPGTPEIPQKYRNTVLVLWRPADTQAPCTYTLERKIDGMRLLDVAECIHCRHSREQLFSSTAT